MVLLFIRFWFVGSEGVSWMLCCGGSSICLLGFGSRESMRMGDTGRVVGEVVRTGDVS